MRWRESEYPDVNSLATQAAEILAQACRTGIAANGRAVLALAGGRTPLPAYRHLAAMNLPWSMVDLVATDERCVPHTHPACNGRELHEAFAEASGITIHMLTTNSGDAAMSEAHARQVLRRFPNAFDAVVLGMGGDAHTASLFPMAMTLPQALADDAEAAYRIDPLPLPPEAPYARITLSRTRICNAHALHLLLIGENKREVLHAAQANPDPLLRPISAFIHAPLHVHWSPT